MKLIYFLIILIMKKILFIFLVIFLASCTQSLNIIGQWNDSDLTDPNMDKLIEDEPYEPNDPNMDKLIEDEPYEPNDPNMDKLIEDEPYEPNDPNMDKLIEDEPYEPDDPNMDKLIEDEPFLELESKKVIIGWWSCNMISKTSTCIEYVWSFWTEQQMKFACYEWVFSLKPCESWNIWGCNIWKGSFSEMIIWMYPYGWSPIPADSASSAQPACDMNPLWSWVNAK